jgi:hypothetical protein
MSETFSLTLKTEAHRTDRRYEKDLLGYLRIKLCTLSVSERRGEGRLILVEVATFR